MKEIISTVENGRADLGLHPQCWLFKESTTSVWLDSTWHCIRVWCIFNPCAFLHFLLHRNIEIIIHGCKAWFVCYWSVLMGISISSALGFPRRCSLIFLSIRLFWNQHSGWPTGHSSFCRLYSPSIVFSNCQVIFPLFPVIIVLQIKNTLDIYTPYYI